MSLTGHGQKPFGPAMPMSDWDREERLSGIAFSERAAPVNGIPRTGCLRRPVMCASSATFLESPRARRSAPARCADMR
jgi:hypothetical protein